MPRGPAPAPPTALTHPFVLPPSLLLLAALLGAALVVANPQGWEHGVACLWLGLAILLLVVYLGFLLVLFSLGSPRFREEGPKRTTRSVPMDTLGSPTGPSSSLAVASSSSSSSRPFLADELRIDDAGSGSGPAAVLMASSPGRKRKKDQRDLQTDLRIARQEYSCDIIFTLLEDRELEVMQLWNMGERVREEGMSWHHFPIRDKWIPSNTARFLAQAVIPLMHYLRSGKRVLVHCNGGKGRTGLLVAAVLLTSVGKSLNIKTLAEATAAMRRSRKGMLKNPLQRFYLRHLHKVLKDM